MPAFVEDLGDKFGYSPRQKINEVPSIGFSGMVDLPTSLEEMKFQIKVLRDKCKVFIGRLSSAMLLGLYYRRKAISAIDNSSLCTADFNVRKSFSANRKTVQGDLVVLRKKFVDSIKDTDLSLVY